MEKILIHIKHKLTLLWSIIEFCNNLLFRLLYKDKMESIVSHIFNEFSMSPFIFRRLDLNDIYSLSEMLKNQTPNDLKYFHPHNFDLHSLRKQFESSSFLMMGVFNERWIVGYFFLRFFLNKKCFVGRIIDKSYRGIGIGLVMNKIMYNVAWRMNFKCLSTISRNNISVMKSHSKNTSIRLIKELSNDYLLVEFINDGQYAD